MPNPCTVCISSHRRAVDSALGAGTAARQIAKKFPPLGERAIQRHRVAHLSPAVVSVVAQREERGAVRIVDRLEALVTRVERQIDQAESTGSTSQMLAASREVRAGLELLARLTGELDEKPVTTVNVLASPEITGIISALLRALEPFPQAKIAAAAALNVIDVEVIAS
jgi:hypothetical protein